MVETLGMIYPGVKFLSSCGQVKLEDKLSASKIKVGQAYNRHFHSERKNLEGSIILLLLSA